MTGMLPGLPRIHPHCRREAQNPVRICVSLRICLQGKLDMVPHLVTALNGPLLDLEKKILDATPAIERWFRLEWQEHTPPFYCSVDLRNAGGGRAPGGAGRGPGGGGGRAPGGGPV